MQYGRLRAHQRALCWLPILGTESILSMVQRNPQESLHKPHNDAVAQVIHRIILIAIIIRLTHVHIRLLAILSVKQEAPSRHLFSDSPRACAPGNKNG